MTSLVLNNWALVDFSAFFTKETTFLISSLLSCTPTPFWKDVHAAELKKRNTLDTRLHAEESRYGAKYIDTYIATVRIMIY